MTTPVHLAAVSGIALVVAAMMLAGPIAGLMVGGFFGLVAAGLWTLVKYN